MSSQFKDQLIEFKNGSVGRSMSFDSSNPANYTEVISGGAERSKLQIDGQLFFPPQSIEGPTPLVIVVPGSVGVAVCLLQRAKSSVLRTDRPATPQEAGANYSRPRDLPRSLGRECADLGCPPGFFSERLEDNVPTLTFPCEGPRPTVETLRSPAEVFDERNVVFHLVQPHSVAEHGGRRQKFGQTWRLLPLPAGCPLS